MKEIFVILFFVVSIPTLMMVHSENEIQLDQNEKIVTVSFSKDSVVIYNKIVDEVGIAMSIYRGAIETRKIASSSANIEQFKKDNKQVLEKLNKNLKLCMTSKSKEEFFSNIHNMTLIGIDYEIKYNILQKDNREIRNKYFNIYKSIEENELQ